MVFGVIGLALGVLGFTYGLKCYYELWKWARECQNVRLAIAYKGKVKWDSPLVEYMLQARMLDRDKDGARGRVIYTAAATQIALRKTDYGLTFSWKQFIRRALFARVSKLRKPGSKTQAPSGPRVKQGHWKGTADGN